MEISASFIEIEDGEVMEPLLCSAEASPEPAIIWKFEDEVVAEGSVLEFSEPIQKYDIICFLFYLFCTLF